MSSPLLEYMYQYTGIDPAYLIIVLAVLVIVLIILTINELCKLKKMSRRLNYFLKGRDGESLEDTLISCIAKSEEIEKMNEINREDIISLRKNQRITYQKMGMVKYNAFREMRGDLSYALVLLDQQDNGFVINSVYGKESGYTYIKEIVNGECDIHLSEEESQALEKAKSQA